MTSQARIVDGSDSVRKLLRGKRAVTRLNPTQKNGCVSGRVNDAFSFYVNPRKTPVAHYLVHIRALGTDNNVWSQENAGKLGGAFKPGSTGHDACVAVTVDSLEKIDALIDNLAIAGG